MLNFRETPEKKTQTKDTDRLGGRTTFGLSRLVSRAIEEEIKQVCLTKNAQKVFCKSALKYAASSEEEEDEGKKMEKPLAKAFPTTGPNFFFQLLPEFSSTATAAMKSGRWGRGSIVTAAVPKLFESI